MKWNNVLTPKLCDFERFEILLFVHIDLLLPSYLQNWNFDHYIDHIFSFWFPRSQKMAAAASLDSSFLSSTTSDRCCRTTTTTYDVEKLLHDLGGFGPFQRRTYFLVCIPAIFCATVTMLYVFIAYEASHRWVKTTSIHFGGTAAPTTPFCVVVF